MALPPHYQDRLRYLRERANDIAARLRGAKEGYPIHEQQARAAYDTYVRLRETAKVERNMIDKYTPMLQQAEAALREEEARVREMERRDREERERQERERARQASDQIYQQGIDRSRRGGLFG